MTFEEVLDQALEMLQRRGRVTYRALQRQFGLDDAYLADLKAEIIEAQRLAVDENGTVLVWTGGADRSRITPLCPTRAASRHPDRSDSAGHPCTSRTGLLRRRTPPAHGDVL